MELKELTIKELLSDNILVIPEIQREYVWGSNKEVLSKFLSELNSSLGEISAKKLQEIKPIFNDEDTAPDMREKLNSSLQKVNNYYETNIGFLYSYDAGNNEHFIIDGQQRLTTIVLLACYYAAKDERVSDFKTLLKTETPLMHFSYRVRPLTEQFLQNLFTGVSLDILKNLKNAKWYVSDYDNDKTIESICNLYKFICDEKNSFCNLNYDSLLQRVKFYYFDVQQTSQGEELYITMNSRGEQLKDSEQIKPYLLEKMGKEVRKGAAKQWDEWEEYFYKKLKDKLEKSGTVINDDEVSKIDIAMDNIIKITSELYGEKLDTETDENRKREFDEIKAAEDSKRIDFSKIKKVVENITSLLDSKNDEIQKLNFETFLFTKEGEKKSLYLLESLIRAKELSIDGKNIHRLIRLINNSFSYGIIKHVPLLKFLSEMKKTDNLYDYIKSLYEKKEDAKILKRVFVDDGNTEELEKIKAILDGSVSEENIESAEALSVFSGKIHLLYRGLSKEVPWKQKEVPWNQFDKRLLKAKEIFTTSDEKHPILEGKYVDFVQKFICAFSEWGQLAYNKYFFSNDLSEWQKFLTDNTYLIPLINALGLSPNIPKWEDKNTKSIWEYFKNSVAEIVVSNPHGRLNWYGKVLAFYPFHGGNDSNSIVFDWENFKRQKFLTELLESKTIELKNVNDRSGNIIKGWDICFFFNGKEYLWTWRNEIRLSESEEIIVDSKSLSGECTEKKLQEIKEKLMNY